MAKRKRQTYALVLSGGGARGAYEAGVIYYLRTQMPRAIARAPLFQIYCGTSVGAINSSFLASTAADPLYQGAQLRKIWRELTVEDVYNVSSQALAGFLVKSGFFAATNFFGLNNLLERKSDSKSSVFPFRSILDTTPFMYFLRRNVAWTAMHRNIERRLVDAVTVSTTHMLSGHLALFVEKHPEVEFRGGGPAPILTSLSPKHVLASAALPLIFPIIRINRQFYGDGSLRQNTPMSPAIRLGADRLLVLSVHSPPGKRPSPGTHLAQYEAEPTLADILGRLVDVLFEDKLSYDLEQMRRINFLIDQFELAGGAGALARLSSGSAQAREPGKDIAEMKSVLPLVISPSEDIGVIASHHFKRLSLRREALSPVHRFFSSVVDSSGDGNNDFLSYLLFQREYLESLIQLGFEDARRAHDDLEEFFSELVQDPASTRNPRARADGG